MYSPVIFRSVGILLLLLAAAMVVSVGLGAVLPAGDTHNVALELTGWKIAIGITLSSGGLLLLLSRYIKRDRAKRGVMLRKEAIALVGIAWLVCSTHAALPYIFCEPTLPLDKALFEAVSGLTTTGATVFTDIEAVPKTILLWRSATQWLGGMGILAMFVLLLSGIGASGRMMFGAESSLHSADLTLSNLRQTTRSLWALYISFTAVCAIGLFCLGLAPFEALNHAMTTTATGGFGTENDSIAGPEFTDAIKIWLVLFMLICGISFPLYLILLRRRRFEDLKNHEETWWFLGIITAASVVIILGHSLWAINESTVDIIFDVVSIATTTGYVVGDYNTWGLGGKEVIFALMVIGGCSGSTSGGLKVSRLILWLRFCRSELTRAFRPKMVQRPTLNKRPVPEGTLGQLFVVLTCASFVLVAGSLFIHFIEGHSVTNVGCVSAVASCLCNIGPAFAEFGPTKNFANLSTPSTLFLPVLMILGRLEYIAVLVLFSRKLWRKY
jgi:trk system potassium uptake protein TrkH